MARRRTVELKQCRRVLGVALAGAMALAGTAFASTPTITLVAGTGVAGFSGDGGPALAAMINLPRAVAVDTQGNLFVADTYNHRIRKIGTDGIITTVAGNGQAGSSGDGGPAIKARIKWPHSVAVDDAGNVYLTDSPNNRVRRVDKNTGMIATIAGTGQAGFSGDGGPATKARINTPKGVMVDAGGNVYIADSLNNRVRRVDKATGNIATVAGNGKAAYRGDGGLATAASLQVPRGMATDAAGNLYIADDDNHAVRRVDQATGRITTIAGTGAAGSSGDGGPATAAKLNNPQTLALDASAGLLYIADMTNSRIRRVDLGTGSITTVVGTGTAGYSGDGGPATAAKLRLSKGVALGPDGTLYIADTSNSRVRKVVGLAPEVAPATETGTEGGAPPPSDSGSDVRPANGEALTPG
jgi:sugar lactone lactonase YvrE